MLKLIRVNNIELINEIQTKKVDSLKISIKYFMLILKIEPGIKSVNEKIVEKHSAKKPIIEIICNLFSIDCFFLVLS